MNKNFLIGAIVIVLLIAGGSLLVKNSKTNPQSTQVEESLNSTVENESESIEEAKEDAQDQELTDKIEDEENTALEQKGVKTFEIDSENFKFSLKEIKVKQGDKVRIVVENDEGMHDWNIDEFNAKTKVLKAGESETVEFIADKKGTFEYYCSVGQHRANGMVGNLIVE